jgi:hypothetical protein
MTYLDLMDELDRDGRVATFTESDYNELTKQGMTYQEIYDLFFHDDISNYLGDGFEVRTLQDAKKALAAGAPSRLILEDLAFFLLGGENGNLINSKVIGELVIDLRPIFRKWVE